MYGREMRTKLPDLCHERTVVDEATRDKDCLECNLSWKVIINPRGMQCPGGYVSAAIADGGDCHEFSNWPLRVKSERSRIIHMGTHERHPQFFFTHVHVHTFA